MHTVYLKDFSIAPAGRTLQDGAYSGERFRRNHILPALLRHDLVTVDLSGTIGLAVSFLEGAFADLDLPLHVLKERLTIVGGVPSDALICWDYLEQRDLP